MKNVNVLSIHRLNNYGPDSLTLMQLGEVEDCKLGKNIVQTRRALYDKAFGQTYADRASLGRPLQRVSELFREYVLVHSMLSFEI